MDDLSVTDVVSAVRRLRDEGVTLSKCGDRGTSPLPRGCRGAALADPYDPARLEAKLDAGADLVWTQIAYDVDGLAAWADRVRPLGVFERASVLVGIVPLRTAQGAFMDERLPGVRVPAEMIAALEAAGDDAEEAGLEMTVDVVRSIQAIDGVRGVHVMGMGHDDAVRAVVERAGLFPVRRARCEVDPAGQA